MQFAVLSGDPKRGAYTQMRKVPVGTDNGLHAHAGTEDECVTPINERVAVERSAFMRYMQN
jgi:hypothetical protein